MVSRLRLILDFYRVSMLPLGGTLTAGLMWIVGEIGPRAVVPCMVGKVFFCPMILYLWVWPRYRNEFYYYRNLGIRRRTLLGVSCAVDLATGYLLLKLIAWLVYGGV